MRGGICDEVCYPRIKKVISGYKNQMGETISGLDGNLRYYKTNFVGSEPTHRNKKILTEKSLEMLCIKENAFEEILDKPFFKVFKNDKKYLGVLLNEQHLPEFKKHVSKLDLPVSVYVFSLEGDDFSEEFSGMEDKVTLCSVPEAILKVYRRIFI